MGRLVQELQGSFERGVLDDVAATRAPANALSFLLNGRIHEDATFERRGGWRRKHAAAIASGVGYGAQWFTTAGGDDHLVAFIGTTAWVSEDSGATWTEVTPETGGSSDLTAGYYDFAEMQIGSTNYLYAANGNTKIWRYDGTTFDSVPNAPEGVTLVEPFNNRLVAAGHSGVLVQASEINDPESWSTPPGWYVRARAKPTAMYQLGPHLLLWDRKSTSYVDGHGEATLVVAAGATGFSRSVGCVAFRTARGVGDNGVAWVSERGLEYYSPSTGIVLISRGVQKFIDAIDREWLKDNPGGPTADYDDQTQRYYLAVSAGATVNDRTLVMHMNFRGRGWIGSPAIDRPQAQDPEVLFVGSDSYLTTTGGTHELVADSQGYAKLSSDFDVGVPITVDEEDYLEASENETMPDTLFMGPSDEYAQSLYALGRDGIVRFHEDGVDNDDEDADATGGSEVEMTGVGRPLHFGSATRKKKVRVLRAAAIASSPATVTLALRTNGEIVDEKTAVIPATGLNQPKRVHKMTSGKGDVAQVEIRTSDKVRVTLLGADAELLKEPVGS